MKKQQNTKRMLFEMMEKINPDFKNRGSSTSQYNLPSKDEILNFIKDHFSKYNDKCDAFNCQSNGIKIDGAWYDKCVKFIEYPFENNGEYESISIDIIVAQLCENDGISYNPTKEPDKCWEGFLYDLKMEISMFSFDPIINKKNEILSKMAADTSFREEIWSLIKDLFQGDIEQ